MDNDEIPPRPPVVDPTPDDGAGEQAARRRTAPDGGPYNPPPDGETDLSELQVRVSRAERAHAALEQTVSELGPGPDLAELRSEIEVGFDEARRVTDHVLKDGFRAVNAVLEEHAAAIARVVERQTANRNPPVNWPALTAADTAQQWALLARWIDEVFVPWCAITRDALPDCWPLHRPVVVQLSWLRSAHIQAYLRASEPSVAGDWHIRWSPAVLDKIKTLIETKWCRPGEHMISVEESNARRREAAANKQTPPTVRVPGAAGRPEQLGRMQLAEREYWDAFFIQARDQDLAWRRNREQLARQAAADRDLDDSDELNPDGLSPAAES